MTYYQLLIDAFHASEAVDLFDLDSRDQKSVEEFDRLNKESHEAQRKLILYINNNPNLINEL